MIEVKKMSNNIEESFNDFIKKLEEKEQPSCNLENPEDCEACGS